MRKRSRSRLPLPGFITSHEVTRIARSAGFEPVAPPLREGTTYVLRAMDFRGILMRVVVDARSGAIRAVNRIVAGPGFYGPPIGMAAPYGYPDGYGLGMAPGDEIVDRRRCRPFVGRTAVHPLLTPPLPRPRPARARITPAPSRRQACRQDRGDVGKCIGRERRAG